MSRRHDCHTRLWLVIGLTFIVTLFAASPAWTAAPVAASADHRHLSVGGDREHLVAADHEHIGVVASKGAPDSFGDVTAPRVRTALIAVAVTFVVALLGQLSLRLMGFAGRDPPRIPVVVLTGQDVLARLCIARR